MSINKYLPHVLVIPEDKANSDIANGFLLHPQLNERSIQVLPYVGGWKIAIEKFKKNFASKMQLYPNRIIILLIDFDGKEERLDYIKKQIPEELNERVFILGSLSNPEELKSTLRKSFESIGESLSANCFENEDGLWSHDLLKHNKIELDRISPSVKPFLFN